jgi:UDP:flavonoid glycosyltransferase YjiC (YdhE family)
VSRSRTLVFATTGSHGDLHPVLALAHELHLRGHRVTVATDRAYQGKVEAMGVGYAVLRPGLEDMSDEPDFYARINHPTRGSEYIVRRLMLPWIERAAEDLEAAFRGADFVLSHPIT